MAHDPEICLHCGGVDMHYEDCLWPTMGQSYEPEREAQARIAQREQELAALRSQVDAYEKAWALPQQGIGQVVTPSAGEVAANAVEEARHYKARAESAERKLATALGALEAAHVALDRFVNEPQPSGVRMDSYGHYSCGCSWDSGPYAVPCEADDPRTGGEEVLEAAAEAIVSIKGDQ